MKFFRLTVKQGRRPLLSLSLFLLMTRTAGAGGAAEAFSERLRRFSSSAAFAALLSFCAFRGALLFGGRVNRAIVSLVLSLYFHLFAVLCFISFSVFIYSRFIYSSFAFLCFSVLLAFRLLFALLVFGSFHLVLFFALLFVCFALCFALFQSFILECTTSSGVTRARVRKA